MKEISEQIIKILQNAGIKGKIELTTPPNSEMGDFAFACFDLAKEKGNNPVEVAKKLTEKIDKEIRDKRYLPDCSLLVGQAGEIIEKAEAMGPYVNFYLNSQELARIVLSEMDNKNFCQNNLGKGKKVMVEFAHPNTHKAFHIGHLRTLITGETVVRVI